MLILNRDMSDDQVVEAMNEEIDHLRSYGVVDVIVPKGVKARRIMWSNGSKAWSGIDARIYKSGETIRVDVNHLIVGNLPYRCITSKGGYWHLNPEIESRLDVLPLYHGSFESKQRGEFDLVNIEAPVGVIENLDDPLNEEAFVAKLRRESGRPDKFLEEWDSKFEN